ncbi:beta-phosphoglucomutase [Sphingomonas floccifaciens]|uniref:Beta-phosphoglucomutase n=1 Tax=Sphingomonas floccifaciens TaxID=1844115 RepID=A0ABW4N906_9SPHN
MNGPFQLAVFDLDGVLADSARLHFVAWKAIADELGIPFGERANEALKGVDRMGSLRAILAIGGVNLPPDEMERLATRKNVAYLDVVETMGPQDLLPGARRLLDAVRARGMPATLASASRNAPRVLERLGIADVFAHVADPARLAPKPAPDLFLDGARFLGIDPQACVGFEDAGAGVVAIKAARMRAIGIGAATDLPGADQVYPTTDAIDIDRAFG